MNKLPQVSYKFNFEELLLLSGNQTYILPLQQSLSYPTVKMEKANSIYNGVKTYPMTAEQLQEHNFCLVFSKLSMENIYYDCNSLHSFPTVLHRS